MKWIFRNKKEPAVAEPIELGMLGAEMPGWAVEMCEQNRMPFTGFAAHLRLDEVERRILALEGKGDGE